MRYTFDWDRQKAKTNFTKHGVDFQQAASVFLDPMMLALFDVEHSEYEERWITIGCDNRGVLLTVCHTFTLESEENARIRIFSARRATAKEKQQYQEV